VGALPVSEIFVAMTDRGFAINDIVAEMNRKLRSELPTGFFCAAGFVDIDTTQNTIGVWNGGLPEIFLLEPSKGAIKRLPSNHLPLGVSEKVNRSTVTVNVTEITADMHLLMYTDGLIEAVNGSGEMFGQKRLISLLDNLAEPGLMLETIRSQVETFRGGAEQHDDISFVQLNCDAARRDIPEEAKMAAAQKLIQAEWRMSFDLPAGILREINPVPMILNVLGNVRLPADHRKRIFTVLTELYTNALDHGLLGLKSELKHSTEGFAAYYMERDKRLSELTEGTAHFELEQKREQDGYVLKLKVSDTGCGFNPQAPGAPAPESKEKIKPSGRGIKLIRSLCSTLEYSDGGRTATASYLLGTDEKK